MDRDLRTPSRLSREIERQGIDLVELLREQGRDVAEIVRCKDCEHQYMHQSGQFGNVEIDSFCSLHQRKTEPEGYCESARYSSRALQFPSCSDCSHCDSQLPQFAGFGNCRSLNQAVHAIFKCKNQTHEKIEKRATSEKYLTESDTYAFRRYGLQCAIQRHPTMKYLCGYVAVPEGHPFHGVSLDGSEFADSSHPFHDITVHGEITFAEQCTKLGSNEFWIGFDCGHYFDSSPGIDDDLSNYRTMFFVTKETMRLAKQLAALLKGEQ